MPTVPESADGWTYDLIKEFAATGQVETDHHDFKHQLPDGDALTKACCAFANSLGGFMVVGVKQRSSRWIPA